MRKKVPKTFKALFEDAECRDTYWVERAALEFTDSVCRLLRERGMSRTDLARQIGSSPAYVTKLLRGDVNFTLQTMVKVSRALGAEFSPVVRVERRQTVATAAPRELTMAYVKFRRIDVQIGKGAFSLPQPKFQFHQSLTLPAIAEGRVH